MEVLTQMQTQSKNNFQLQSEILRFLQFPSCCFQAEILVVSVEAWPLFGLCCYDCLCAEFMCRLRAVLSLALHPHKLHVGWGGQCREQVTLSCVQLWAGRRRRKITVLLLPHYMCNILNLLKSNVMQTFFHSS